METKDAIVALSALAHEGRMAVFRLLVRAGPQGLSAGEIAEATGALANTLSTNLGILARAGLVTSRREGRSIIYSAGFEGMRELLAFLMEDCCAGQPEVCNPLGGLAPDRVCAETGASC